MTQTEQLEEQKVDLKRQVELRDQILKLSTNYEFRKVFHDEFFVKEAARLVRTAGDPNLDEKQRADAMQMALAAGHVQRFLSAQIAMGNQAANYIGQIDQALEEIRVGGQDDDDDNQITEG